MFKISNTEAGRAKTIKWDYIEGNIVKFYDTTISGITKDIFTRLDEAISRRELDIIKPIALLVNQNASVSRTKTRSPYFGVMQGATDEGRTYWIDTQYIATKIMTKGVMTKHSHFPSNYPSLSNFYIANNTRDFVFGLDIDMNYKRTDILGSEDLTDLFYVIGVKQSYIHEKSGNNELADLGVIKTILSDLKFGIDQKEKYHYEGSNLVENDKSFVVPQLIKDMKTMIAIPMPECNYIPKFDIQYNNNDVYIVASSTVNAALFMYEFILNNDIQDDFTDYIYNIDTGMNEFGNNIFRDNVWAPTDEDKRIAIIDDNKEYLDSLKDKKQDTIEQLNSDDSNTINIESIDSSDEALKQMMHLAGVDDSEDNSEDLFNDIIDNIGG